MNIEYKEEQFLIVNQDRIQESIDRTEIFQDNEEEEELINDYQNLKLAYSDRNLDKINEELYQIRQLLTDKTIYFQSNNAFLDLAIPNILLDIAFVDNNWPNQCINNSRYLIDYYLTLDHFYQNSFVDAGILDFLINGINDEFHNIDHISDCVKILVSLIWQNQDLTPIFFQKYHEQISQFINSFFESNSEEYFDKKSQDFQTYTTNFIYSLSFSITSEDEAMFIYTYIEYVAYRNDINPEFNCNPLYILYIAQNIAIFKQPLDSIFNNDLIIKMMNKALFSRNAKNVQIAIDIVHIFIENDYDISDKFSLYNFFRLIDENENEIVERAAECIYHSLLKNPYNKELRMIKNISGYFLAAFDRGNYTMKIQLIQTLCLVIRNVSADILSRWVRNNLVQILILSLEFDQDEIIFNVLHCLIIIWHLDPVIDDKGNNVAIADFEQNNGKEKIEILESNEDLSEIVDEFMTIFRQVDEKNENEERFL